MEMSKNNWEKILSPDRTMIEGNFYVALFFRKLAAFVILFQIDP
jgi:hypothetical protein